MPGSRDRDIAKAWSWIDSLTNNLVFWIHAPAGEGKSTFACKLKEELRYRNRLAAAVFLSRLPLGVLDAETLIKLIGGEIGWAHRQTVPIIAEAVRQIPGKSLDFHIEKFIRDPLLSLQLPHPLIIVIDGITEWMPHAHFIEHLTQLTPHVSLIRFVVLGRSEPHEDGI